MLKKMMKRLKKEEKGFTLIELLAVIVILAVIAVIAVPLIGKIIDNTKQDADVATARQVYDAARLYITGEEDGVFESAASAPVVSVSISELKSAGYLANDTVLPSSKAPLTGGTVTFKHDGTLDTVSLTTGTNTTKTIDADKVLAGKN
ncbi:prepilin-type N-terminal cleavage/methylation domain-containing protein [Paenibacillus glycanilyticus]|uniref:prepilin-type N-terminal cleavage/methylation domain-containing protein n=1 Tax=Paenibacillus glycanilyticus TaxID=126569 RepID=UPI000FD8D76B|nr:prepilin-type N-terminal cleavage/methylation domain-containing protein [Paenibacillus glycanilyticus]